MEIIKRIEKWQRERLLDKQEFNYSNESVNIIEELIEMSGYEVPKEKREILKNEFSKFKIKFIKQNNLKQLDGDDGDIIVDALFDICVFAIGGMLKAGYEPTCVFNEGLKEIESRVGSIVNGKFQKDSNKKHLWYKAEYSKCKRKKDGI